MKKTQKNWGLGLNGKLLAHGCMVVFVLLLIGLANVTARPQVGKPTPTLMPKVTTTTPKERMPIPTPTPASTLTPTLTEGSKSEGVIKQAWGALRDKRNEEALAYAQKVIDMWSGQANEQQAMRKKSASCEKTPTPEEAYNSKYWALRDVAQGWIIRGRALSNQGKSGEANDAFVQVLKNYDCAFYWDPKGRRNQGIFVSAARSAGGRYKEEK